MSFFFFFRNEDCDSIRKMIAGIYESIINVVKTKEFDDHDRDEGDMDAAKMLEIRRDDIMKTDCPIVFSGK